MDKIIMQTITIEELFKDGTFEKAILQIEVNIKEKIDRIHHYYYNGFLLEILENEIDEIVDLIRRANSTGGIPWIPFEYYISGIYHDMAFEPSIKNYERIKQDILHRWTVLEEGCGCGC